MKQKFYPHEASEDYLHFWFESYFSGRKIPKIVVYEEINKGTYNLAFGDVDENGRLDDSIVSKMLPKMKEARRVLATLKELLTDNSK